MPPKAAFEERPAGSRVNTSRRGEEMEGRGKRNFVFPFEKLEVWQLAVDLADFVLGLLESMPPNKYVRVIGQAQAAVTSVAQNIAEGKGRQYKKEFIQFLYISEGSLFELLTLVEVLHRRGLIVDDTVVIIREKAENLDRKIHGLIRSLKKRS
jgi:four helix bundle protein